MIEFTVLCELGAPFVFICYAGGGGKMLILVISYSMIIFTFLVIGNDDFCYLYQTK